MSGYHQQLRRGFFCNQKQRRGGAAGTLKFPLCPDGRLEPCPRVGTQEDDDCPLGTGAPVTTLIGGNACTGDSGGYTGKSVRARGYKKAGAKAAKVKHISPDP